MLVHYTGDVPSVEMIDSLLQHIFVIVVCIKNCVEATREEREHVIGSVQNSQQYIVTEIIRSVLHHLSTIFVLFLNTRYRDSEAKIEVSLHLFPHTSCFLSLQTVSWFLRESSSKSDHSLDETNSLDLIIDLSLLRPEEYDLLVFFTFLWSPTGVEEEQLR